MVKRRFENKHPSASIWLFVKTVPGPPNDVVSHRLCQILVDPRGIQEVTEHHEILWPLVLPLLAFLYVRLVAGNRFLERAGWGTRIIRRWKS